MADNFEFVDNKVKVIKVMNQNIEGVLEEVAGEIESQTKRNTRVDTGRTKNSWQHKVTEDDGVHIAVIGSDYENAIWEEFGTGDYALKGNGRKGGWFYEDAKGDGHFTYGKRPSRAFHNAYTSLKNAVISKIQSAFKKGL